MTNAYKKLLSLLAHAFVIFIGIYGAVFCVVTAYNVNLETTTVIFYYIVCSIVFSAVFFAEKYKVQILVSALGITLTVFFINYTNIYNGFALFLNQITSMFSKFSSFIKVTEDVYLSKYGKIEASTAFFAFVGAVLIIFAAYVLIKRSSAGLLTALLSAIFSLSLIFIKRVPGTFPLICYISFLLTIMLTNLARKKDKISNSKIYAAILPLLLVFLIVIGAVFPPDSYKRTDFASKMYTFFSERLPITIKSSTGEGSLGSDGSLTSGADISGDTSDPGYGRASDGVNLSDADPSRLTDRKMMTVTTNRTGGLLLRGYSFGEYTGSTWQIFDKITMNELNKKLFVQTIPGDNPPNTWCNPITLASYTALSSLNNRQKYEITLTDEYSGGEVAFLPYFSIVPSGSISFKNDSVTLYSPNVNNTLKSKASYSLTFYDCDSIMSGGNPDRSIYDSNAFVDIKNFENQYRQSVYNKYTYVDSGMRNFLSDYTRQFSNNSNRQDVVLQVASFIKNSAAYNISAPKTPDGKDFVKYFLEESKEGSCMHFASAATLMYRSLGIPARFVMGYAKNITNNQVGKSVSILEKDSHAWVEVYIDGVGWIPVDVTPGSIGNRPGETSGETSGIIPVESEVSVIVSVPSEVNVSGEVPYNPVSGESDVSVEDSDISDESSMNSSGASTSSEESEIYRIPFYIKYKDVLAWVCPIAAVVLLAAFVILRRLYILKKRKDTYKKADRNIAAIEGWHYIEKLIPYGLIVEKAVYRTAQKAVFSKHQLTDEELKRIIRYAELKSEEIYNKLDFFKKFVFKFIKAMK